MCSIIGEYFGSHVVISSTPLHSFSFSNEYINPYSVHIRTPPRLTMKPATQVEIRETLIKILVLGFLGYFSNPPSMITTSGSVEIKYLGPQAKAPLQNRGSPLMSIVPKYNHATPRTYTVMNERPLL